MNFPVNILRPIKSVVWKALIFFLMWHFPKYSGSFSWYLQCQIRNFKSIIWYKARTMETTWEAFPRDANFISHSYSIYNVSVKLVFQCQYWTMVSVKQYVLSGQIYNKVIIKTKLKEIECEEFTLFLSLVSTHKERGTMVPWLLQNSFFCAHSTPEFVIKRAYPKCRAGLRSLLFSIALTISKAFFK